ncbi:SDR family oxidoreductase [Maribacter cobaltidurans]|uniref:Short-chain dehydrogenase/reductase n=1 Tax=Maribacter cobaltidurans TaxID=1178778 RepID=A0A223V9L4_9FLAO|nr:SDR family oxidoreductase [Maribacter cobaltidurans]ASV32016.1 short-chain dehydrogenase/reductase [Maribacter cobaltidurans]GGD86488.1 short-chain dehydrogenase/reductase [Maribacter cobaltidurans]
MDSKIVLITGGSSGIGKAIGIYLTKKGFTVYGTTRNLKKYPDFTEFQLLEMDVREPQSVNRAIDVLLEKENRLDVLVNNAGVGITGPLEETPNKEILNAFDINFIGPLNVIKSVLPQMRRQGSGLIINITSIAGYMGLPYRGIYSATKGALELITESLRMEIKDFGITCTCLAPGDFATNIAAGRYHAPVNNDSPYKESYGKTLNTIDQDVDKGGDPEEVAKKVLQIINTKNPKVHYKVGALLQKFSIVLKKVLPDTWYEQLLLNHSKK